MNHGAASLRSAASAMAIAILFAYSPSIGYIGHWDLRIDLPGEHNHWHIPLFSSGHSHHHGYGKHSNDHGHHSDHCHGDAASCTTVPLTTVSPVTYLRSMVELVAQGGSLEAGHLTEQAAPAAQSYAPEVPPPRSFA